MPESRSKHRGWLIDLRLASILTMLAAFLAALAIWAFDPPPVVSTVALVVCGLGISGLAVSHLGEGVSGGFEFRHDPPVVYRDRPVAYVLLFVGWSLLLVWGVLMAVGSLIPVPGAA